MPHCPPLFRHDLPTGPAGPRPSAETAPHWPGCTRPASSPPPRGSSTCRPRDVPEIAFVGRSNAGKSTCINTLTQQKRLAFASKTPGRTQHINLFALGPSRA